MWQVEADCGGLALMVMGKHSSCLAKKYLFYISFCLTNGIKYCNLCNFAEVLRTKKAVVQKI